MRESQWADGRGSQEQPEAELMRRFPAAQDICLGAAAGRDRAWPHQVRGGCLRRRSKGVLALTRETTSRRTTTSRILSGHPPQRSRRYTGRS